MPSSPPAKSSNARNSGKAARSHKLSDANHNSSSTRSRQRPGAACHECRGRKLRCDRKQPICGACEGADLTCQYTTVLAPRGPKPGYLKDLQARLASVEDILCQTTQQQASWMSKPSPELVGLQDWPQDPILPFHPPSAGPVWTGINFGLSTTRPFDNFDLEALSTTNLTPDRKTSIASTSISNYSCSPETPSGLPDNIQSTLDQLYWNKIHPSLPILHYRRYMSWSSRTDKSITKECLQNCMWMISASASTDYDHAFTDRLYRHALQSMQRIDACADTVTSSDRTEDLEQVQSLLMLSLYELKYVDFRRGWITAGRAFSLIQLSLIQDIPSWAPSLALPMDWIAVDEKRRVFWLAFCLDRFISLRNNSPCTLGEQFNVPLPDLDDDFQRGNFAVPVYLNEILDNSNFQLQSPYAEFNVSILLAKLCSDVILHRSQSLSDENHSADPERFWTRHQQLVDKLTQHVRAFIIGGMTQAHNNADPTRLFLGTMWITLTLYHYRTLTMFIVLTGSEVMTPETTEKSSMAAQHLTVLMHRMLELNGRELHPLTLVPLKLCNELLDPWPELSSIFGTQLASITAAIGNTSERSQREYEKGFTGNIDNINCTESILESHMFNDV